MKRLSLFGLTIILSMMLAACGPSKSTVENPNNAEKATQTASNKPNESNEPNEPTTDTVCAFCNMKVYAREEQMGVFTAQAITHDHKHLYFDDSGCILNYERKTGDELTQKWVRDYLTSEWVDADTAVPVKSDVQTPMKYGYSFFSNQEDAETFIANHSELQPSITDWESIDSVANERYQKKMQMQKEQNNAQMNHNQ